jgi:hypothetical protein
MTGTGTQAIHRDDVSNGDVLRDIDIRHIGISELSPTEWRICDRTIADGDPSALLGFIQRVGIQNGGIQNGGIQNGGGAYEVTYLGRLRERSYFSSFDRAAASLAARPRQAEAALR